MTANDFRKLALGLDGAIESEHMSHPDFRVNGKIFASLGYPDKECAMVKLTPEEQQRFMKIAPDTFKPCNGVWGNRGATSVDLLAAKKHVINKALKAAYESVLVQARKK